MEASSPGTCTGILATLPVPMDWPEQQVRIVDQQATANVGSVRYRTISGGVRQMLITIPRMSPGQTAKVSVTFEVTRQSIAAPQRTEHLRVPATLPRELRGFLGTSPLIETTHPKIRHLSAQLAESRSGAWVLVEALYDWVQEHVRYQFDEQLQGALAALDSGRGDCEELTSLFIALCRNNGVPARSVWVPGHCYPEFYLEDESGNGRWYPCQSAGSREFGAISELRPILQKGDEFDVPGQAKPKRYVAETFQAKNATANPQVQFFQRPLQ